MVANNRCPSRSAIHAHTPLSIYWIFRDPILEFLWSMSKGSLPGCDPDSLPIVEFHSKIGFADTNHRKDGQYFCKLHASILRDANAIEWLNGIVAKQQVKIQRFHIHNQNIDCGSVINHCENFNGAASAAGLSSTG